MKQRCIGWHSLDIEMEKQFLGFLESSRLHIHSVSRPLMPSLFFNINLTQPTLKFQNIMSLTSPATE